MTQSPDTPATTTTAATAAPEPGVAHVGESASIWRVLRDQRKALYLALGFAVAAFWICGQLDRWTLATAIALGVLLGLVNHLVTELWLLRTITSGRERTRNQMITTTVARLAVLTFVAVGLTVLLWPDGVGVLFGLAIFRLIALAMTSLTLLKELKTS